MAAGWLNGSCISGADSPGTGRVAVAWALKKLLIRRSFPLHWRLPPVRSPAEPAIVVNGSPYLVDFGTGIVRQAAAARKEGVRRLDLHSDHTLGFPDLILTPWVVGRKEPLEVYGPPRTGDMAEHILKGTGRT